MYCPNCGSNNQAELKFCTQCGTNLSVVSEALTSGAGAQLDDRMVKIIKEYYKGRRDTITGLVLIPAAVKLIAMLVLLGLPPVTAFFIVSWMIFWGIAALAGGLGKWSSAAGEMRALGHELPKNRLLIRALSCSALVLSMRPDSASTQVLPDRSSAISVRAGCRGSLAIASRICSSPPTSSSKIC